MRIGHGFDAHPLAAGRPCVLGGVTIPSDAGPVGHSDGDVVLHALAGALLGAAAAGDLGSVFGTDRPEWKNAAGEALVRHVRELTDHPEIGNVDVTILAARPPIAEHRETMRANIAALLGTSVRVPDGPRVRGNRDAAEDARAPGRERMRVEAVPDPHALGPGEKGLGPGEVLGVR
ncbi:MAG TPA: 2-C-methyl-D-erythritol 2,4-cyclodiphosphate synthase, partial [Thermoanaerobaculia bacterium]|nr:2-C-methyl-D-erythritol 2,4-cyclodiphosphate synthase [Thermoanaerobaculia bacterium]